MAEDAPPPPQEEPLSGPRAPSLGRGGENSHLLSSTCQASCLLPGKHDPLSCSGQGSGSSGASEALIPSLHTSHAECLWFPDFLGSLRRPSLCPDAGASPLCMAGSFLPFAWLLLPKAGALLSFPRSAPCEFPSRRSLWLENILFVCSLVLSSVFLARMSDSRGQGTVCVSLMPQFLACNRLSAIICRMNE